MAGLGAVADKRAGGFSLGMSQRLGIATALLGDPTALVLDEPVNGLDPDGVLWLRHLLVRLAAEGRTVFLSSHLMSEMAVTADHLIVLGRGSIIADAPVATILAAASGSSVRLRSPQAPALAQALAGPDVSITSTSNETLEITGLTAPEIGEAAARAGIALHELTPGNASLEEAYMELTQNDVEYHTGTPTPTLQEVAR